MYWCYIDESWRDGQNEKIGVLAATIGSAQDFKKLDQVMYQARRKYLGEEHAKDLARPFRELCIRLMAAIPQRQKGIMVFDQRVGAQEDISIAISNYLAGMASKQTFLRLE